MTGTVLFLTSKNGPGLENLLQTASMASDSGSHVRVLLVGDAVLSAAKGSTEAKIIQGSSQIEFLACKGDLESRGLMQRLEQTVRAIDYVEIVDLLMTNDDKVVSYV
jgi:sulfur relay protein TusB/DsrH